VDAYRGADLPEATYVVEGWSRPQRANENEPAEIRRWKIIKTFPIRLRRALYDTALRGDATLKP
jgi:hypothetical protein